MALKLLLIASVVGRPAQKFVSKPCLAYFSSRVGGRKPIKRTTARSPAPATTALAIEDAWEEVVDKASGQIYYWNTQTNETTQLGAPRPTGPTALGPSSSGAQVPAQQQSGGGGMMAGLGGMVAQGFAFGVGSSVAHSVVGSIFGGSSGGGDSGSSDDGGFDI